MNSLQTWLVGLLSLEIVYCAEFIITNEEVDIPFEIIDLICWHLDPYSLARTSCVSRTWREAASADALWRLFFEGCVKSPPNLMHNKATFGKLAAGLPAAQLGFSILYEIFHQDDIVLTQRHGKRLALSLTFLGNTLWADVKADPFSMGAVKVPLVCCLKMHLTANQQWQAQSVLDKAFTTLVLLSSRELQGQCSVMQSIPMIWEVWRSCRRMNIMSKSLPVIVRLEWVPASTISARNLLNLASAPATPELHAPSIDQVGLQSPTESLCHAFYYFLNCMLQCNLQHDPSMKITRRVVMDINHRTDMLQSSTINNDQ